MITTLPRLQSFIRGGGGWYYLNNLLDSIDTSITNINNSISKILDKVYPVGSIYLSMNATNPKDLFGGTWTQISQGRCILGVGSPSNNNTDWCGTLNNDSYNFWAGEMGGQYSHQLTTQEIPSHAHQERLYFHGYSGFSGGSSGGVYVFNWSSGNCIVNQNSSNTSSLTQLCNQPTTHNAGGGSTHNNVMPYMAVYIWQRTG